MKRVRPHEFQHLPINDRPQRLHQIEHKRRPLHIVCMKKADRRVVTVGGNLHPYLTFEHSIGVVQDRVDGVGRISILPNFIPSGGPWPNLMPIIWNWTPSEA